MNADYTKKRILAKTIMRDALIDKYAHENDVNRLTDKVYGELKAGTLNCTLSKKAVHRFVTLPEEEARCILREVAVDMLLAGEVW